MALLIFTDDLDGSLLDHDGCSVFGARPALARIRRLAIPLLITTGKTRAEVEGLYGGLKISQSFIVENGGGLFFPATLDDLPLPAAERCGRNRLQRLGLDYAELRGFLGEYGRRFQVRGFGDMAVAEVAERCGLSLRQAALAKKREFSEPFVCAGALEEFRGLAARHGLAITRGDRFYQLVGSGQNQGRAVRAAIRAWRVAGRPVMAIGLGAGPNDEPLLANVEIPVQIPRADGSFAELAVEGVVRAKAPGGRGWGAAVMELLDDWENGRGFFARDGNHRGAPGRLPPGPAVKRKLTGRGDSGFKQL